MPKKSTVKTEAWWKGDGSREDDMNSNNRLDVGLEIQSDLESQSSAMTMLTFTP